MTHPDMESVARRLKEAREKMGLNPRQMAVIAKIDPSQYSKVEKGQQKLGAEKLYGVASAHSINIDWLLTGDGEMFHSKRGQSSTTGADAKTPVTSAQQTEMIPDPTMPGIYQDLVRELIQSSASQRRLSDALLEERQHMRETVDAVKELAGKVTVPQASEMQEIRASLVEHDQSIGEIHESIKSLEQLVAFYGGKLAGKTPDQIEGILLGIREQRAGGNKRGKKTIKDN